MNDSVSPSLFDKLLIRFGGFYLIFVAFITQSITIPLGFLIAAQILSLNGTIPSNVLWNLAPAAMLFVLIRNIGLLLLIYYSNKSAIKSLNYWKKDQLSDAEGDALLAWKQITSFAWRYFYIGIFSLLFFSVPATLAYLHFYLGISTDQLLYTLFASIVAGLSISLVEVLLLETLLKNTRLILLPDNFDAQAAGAVGAKFFTKYQIVFFVLILISLVLVAPIGYRQTTRVLYEDIGSQEVLIDLQIQSLIAGIFTLLLGFGLSFLMTRSTTQTIRQMIQTFEKVEKGNLEERLPVTSTDEIGEVSVFFNRMLKRLENAQSGLETQVASRTAQLNATIEVGHVASGILNPEELIHRVVNLITDRFDYYYAALFLIDTTGRWAVLADATGDAGATLKNQRHRLEIGGKSMVGSSIATRQAKIALDVGLEPVRFDNPLLPHTRSEIAIPLIMRDRIIGALDVQSTKENAFHLEDVDTLQSMANQVAIALENARLFQDAQNNLDELRSATRQYITSAWADKGGERRRFEYSSSDGSTNDGETIHVPVTLREQNIGVISLEADHDWTQEEKGMIEAVATQAALALENARLLEESQEIAIRERVAAEIIGKVWSSPSADTILRTAVKELGRALRADEALIDINID